MTPSEKYSHVNGGDGAAAVADGRSRAASTSSPALGSTRSSRSPAGRAISTSGTVAFSTVTPTAIVDGCPTGICTGMGQMCADAGATPIPSAVAVAATVASAKPTSRRTRERYRPPSAPDRVPTGSRPVPRAQNRYARARAYPPARARFDLVDCCCSRPAGVRGSRRRRRHDRADRADDHRPRRRAGRRQSVEVGEDDLRDGSDQTDIYDQATGVKTTSITTPTWIDHVYSCDYVYPGGVKIGLVGQGALERRGDHRVLRLARDALKKTKDVPGTRPGRVPDRRTVRSSCARTTRS